MFAVQGIYDGGAVTLSGSIPVKKKYDVVVTFLNPVEQETRDEIAVEKKLAALKSLTGIVAGNTMTLDEIKAARLARQ